MVAAPARHGHRQGIGHWARPVVLVAAVCGVYLSNGRFVESTDTIGSELLPLSLLRYHSLTFDQYYVPADESGQYPPGEAAVVPGSTVAQYAYRVTPDVAERSLPWWFTRRNDHVISHYPILPGLLNTPVHFVAMLLGVAIEENVAPLAHVTSSVIAALSVLCMYLCLLRICREQRAAVFITLAYAFATAVWSTNSLSLFQHGTSVLFITAALACVLATRERVVALAGLWSGLAIAARPTDVIIAVALGLFVCRRRRAAFPGFAALLAIPMLLLAWYSWIYWGTPFALGQGQGLGGFTATEPAVALAGLLFSPNRGLLVFSPVFIFSVAYGVHIIRSRTAHPLLPYLVWSALALYLLYALWSDWAGGHTYGYRYLIEAVPALTLVLAVCWERVIEPRLLLRGLFLVALLASMYVHGLGATAAPCGFDEEPNNIDFHHERLWDIADGEIARCTRRELSALQSALSR